MVEGNKMEATKTADNGREERGRQIAKLGKIKQVGPRYLVPSQAGGKGYVVDLVESTCTCPDHELRHTQTCKHQHAVLFWIAWERNVAADGTVTETVQVKRKTYPQKDWSAYNASQAYEKEYVERLLRALCAGVQDPPRKPGPGAPPIALADKVFTATMKIYTSQSGRGMKTDLRRSVERGDLADAPSCGSIWGFFQKESTTPLLVKLIEESAAPLAVIENGQFAIDSTGFSTVTYDRWFDQKHGKLMAQHPWIKLHIMVGTVTHAITALKVSPEADCPLLPSLTRQTMKRFTVQEVSADKAYSSVDNLKTLDDFGIEAFIPFKENAVVNPKSEAWTTALMKFHFRQDYFLPHYHRRSNVESTMLMIKKKFGGAVVSKRPVAQVNEVLAKCLAHNLCCVAKAIFTSGLAPEFWKDAPAALPAAGVQP